MNNEYEVRGDVTAIIINSPKYGRFETLISTNKLDRVKEFTNSWFVIYSKITKSFYVYGNTPVVKTKRYIVSLHRWITNAQKGLVVDHINHNTLDNTDHNLRVVTKDQNQQNRKGAQSNSKSGIRGVCWGKSQNKWKAQINVDGEKVIVGYFKTIQEAEEAVKHSREKHYIQSYPKEG